MGTNHKLLGIRMYQRTLAPLTGWHWSRTARNASATRKYASVPWEIRKTRIKNNIRCILHCQIFCRTNNDGQHDCSYSETLRHTTWAIEPTANITYISLPEINRSIYRRSLNSLSATDHQTLKRCMFIVPSVPFLVAIFSKCIFLDFCFNSSAATL